MEHAEIDADLAEWLFKEINGTIKYCCEGEEKEASKYGCENLTDNQIQELMDECKCNSCEKKYICYLCYVYDDNPKHIPVSERTRLLDVTCDLDNIYRKRSCFYEPNNPDCF